jgi:uncharacterized RDD family membrane protein YckC
MQITCPHCRRELNVAGDPPSFCAYCGHSLSRAGRDTLPTQPFRPVSPTKLEETPAAIGGFRVVRRLGSGGMGVVLEACESSSGRHVAIKLLSEQLIDSPSTLERFRQEGRVASQIAHPRCVFVLRTDEDAGRPYIVMELMPGYTLRDLVAEAGPLAVSEAVARILEVIDGLQEAHRLGVIHRDVKPSNCFLLEDGTAKVGDFGLCKIIQRDGQLTMSGGYVGTVLFSAPEQLRNDPLDYRADVYSVAATLYFLLTGQAPHSSESHTEAVARAASEDSADVRQFRPDVPRPLARIVRKGLRRDRTRRWQTLEAMRAALKRQVPSELTAAGLGLRVGAFLIDQGVLSARLLLPWEWVKHVAPANPELVTYSVFIAIFFLYFAVTEGLWGGSVGKRLLGLRVARTDRFEPPGLKRAALRAAVFALVLAIPQVCYLLPINDAGRIGMQVLSTAVLGLALAWPMRPRNAYRGLHELASGTRVVQLPWPERSREYPGRGAELTLAEKPDGVPNHLGPFTVLGLLGGDDGQQWLLAEDRTLNRKTLIRLCAPSVAPVSSRRRELSRPGRLRWLACGKLGERDWDAFVAPSGSPLARVVTSGEPMAWAAARPILEQLAKELADAALDDSLPDVLTPEQVWIQTDGRMQLLDAPFAPVGGARWLTPLELLRQAAVQLLEARPDGEKANAVRAPVPRHATPLLNRLMGGANGDSTPGEMVADLEKTRGLPTEVTFRLKAGYLWLLAVLLSLGLISMFASSLLGSALNAMRLYEEIRVARDHGDDLTRIEAMRAKYIEARASLGWVGKVLMLGDPPADGKTRLGGGNQTLLRTIAGRLAIAQDQGPEFQVKVVGAAISTPMVFWPAAWTAWAFLFRGGISLRLMHLRLVCWDGKPAGALRCAARTAVVWLPVTLLLLTVNALHVNAGVWSDVADTVWWFAIGLIGAYLYLALLLPARGPHDMIAGTWLVPE